MVTTGQSTQVNSSSSTTVHPSIPERQRDRERDRRTPCPATLGERVKFESVVLNEPPKESVLSPNGSGAIDRQAFIILLDGDTGETYEAVVSLTKRELTSWTHVPGVQPRLMVDELFECEKAVKESRSFWRRYKREELLTPTW